MTIQQTAHELLKEVGKPLSSRKLAKAALERHMASSSAKDPIHSLAQTIEKNIRDELYNQPRLEFVMSTEGRLIGLPGWNSHSETPPSSMGQHTAELRIQVPTELMDQLHLAAQAKVRDSFSETVEYLIGKGFASSRPEIRSGLMRQLEALEQDH